MARSVNVQPSYDRLFSLWCLGFYAGFWPNVWKVMPAAIITFVAYENIAKMLSAQRSSSSTSTGR